MHEEVTAIGLRQGGGAVVSFRSAVSTIDFLSGEISNLTGPILQQSNMRFNDGRCDRRGRFWVGSLHEERQPETASLYRIDPNGAYTETLKGITVSNGIAWSPDNRILYFADSWTRTIFSFDFDLDSGAAHNKKVFVQLPEGAGVPDGATVDAEGFLWSAIFDGGCVTRYAPDGRVDRVIKMPVQRPTSCAFGGDNFSILYVTSASMGLSEQQRIDAPLAGGLFAIDAGVKGLPEPRFAG
jgi:L-arabinonolactonase